MTPKESIQYLANILCVIYSDGDPTKVEEQGINTIARKLGLKAAQIAKAFEHYQESKFELSFPFRYSYRIRNLEDMIRVAIVDGRLNKEEQDVIKEAFKKLDLSKEQFQIISEEAKTETQLS